MSRFKGRHNEKRRQQIRERHLSMLQTSRRTRGDATKTRQNAIVATRTLYLRAMPYVLHDLDPTLFARKVARDRAARFADTYGGKRRIG